MAATDDGPANASAEAVCLGALMKYDRALRNTLDWSFARKNSDQIRVVHTDEDEGRFKVVGLRPGIYNVVATGQAGFNEAVWEEPLVQVKPGAVVNLKLSHTEFSCLSTN
jgi:hypothetical protein